MSKQSGVKKLAKDLLSRFTKIDELCNNAGNLTVGGERVNTEDGVDENIAVNVIAPCMLTRLLVPDLKAASPTGKVQITTGGLPIGDLDLDDIESQKGSTNGLQRYSHSKRVMEAMCIALARELQPEGISVNVVGGGLPGANSMTSVVSFSELPWFMKAVYPCFSAFMHRDDKGKSAKACAKPTVWATQQTAESIGSGNNHTMGEPKKEKWRKNVSKEENQARVMEFISQKMK